MKKRIWELDFFRGVCIWGMVFVHLVFDLVDLFGIVAWEKPVWFRLLKNWGGVLFLVLSGICVTLGSRPIRRGLIVFACGMACTLVTVGMVLLGFDKKDIIISFGVLHCLGCCMLLWGLFQRLSWKQLTVIGLLIAAVGLYLMTKTPVSFPWLSPLGICSPDFSSADYFPLMPNLGYFLLGAALGRTVYREHVTRFPKVSPQRPFIRFFVLSGQKSLLIYLLHQPILFALVYGVEWVKSI